MLLCGIIDEMRKMNDFIRLSYFFCQATDIRLNSATCVLRGLIWLLADQHPNLLGYIRERYDIAGKKIFDGPNAWTTLMEVLIKISSGPEVQPIYLFIDALDECLSGLLELLDLIRATSPQVKWIVTSRNRPDLKELLDPTYCLPLELNTLAVSAAVDTFIEHKLSHLSYRKSYDAQTRNSVREYLVRNADDTFLWVALVCQRLETILGWKTLDELHQFPSDLTRLYGRMIVQVDESADKGLLTEVLALITVACRPITLSELRVILNLSLSNDWAQQIIEQCGSFLTIRESTIYFVHQSAKDFLTGPASYHIFHERMAHIHDRVLHQSLKAMAGLLGRDMYELGAPGISIEEIMSPVPSPLEGIAYSCLYWVHHLEQGSGIILQDGGIVDIFLRAQYLYWLEALSLLHSVTEGVIALYRLGQLLKV
jgi:NACHT domain